MNLSRKLLFTFSMMMLVMVSQAQEKGILTSAQIYLDALYSTDYNTLAEYTNEDIIEMGGGLDFFIQEAEKDFKQIKQTGLNTVETSVQEEGEIINLETEMLSVVPYRWIVNFGDKSYISTNHLLASSRDQGKSWKFVNLAKYDANSIKVFLPQLPATFDFPAASPFEELR